MEEQSYISVGWLPLESVRGGVMAVIVPSVLLISVIYCQPVQLVETLET